jgi:NADH-quinone oxidoreductase subunit N
MKVTSGIQDLMTIFPLLVVFLCGCLPIAVKSVRRDEQRSVNSLCQALFGVLFAAGWVLITGDIGTQSAFDGALVIDGTSYPAVFIILLSGAGALLMAHENINTKGYHFSEFVFLLSMSMVGMLTFIWADDLLVTFIGLEIMSIALYLLIAMSHEQTLAKEAAFKYFILGSFSAAIFLYGLAFIFGATGTTYLASLKEVSTAYLEGNRLFAIGWALMVVGFAFKVSIFPFHFWTPDVYQGAPTPVTGFMATAVKAAGFTALLRFIMHMNFTHNAMAMDLLQWMAVLTILVGNVAAVVQDNFKRMLAYSSVAHSGYMLIAIVVAGSGAGELGANALLFYLAVYVIMNLGAFAMLGLFEKFEEQSLNIDDLRGLAHRHPYLAFAMAAFLLSLAGIPPTAGFFGKVYLFSAAVNEGFIWLAVWGVLGSVISVYYYLRPIVVMYMSEETGESTEGGGFGARATVFVTAVLVFLVGLAASPIMKLIQLSVRSLFY